MIFDLLFDSVVGALTGKSWGCLMALIVLTIALISVAIWMSL
jgi:hypothetical protein